MSPRLVLSAAGVPIEESMVGNSGVAEAVDEFSATCGKSEMNFKMTVLERPMRHLGAKGQVN